jgi:hypothetical protein
VKGRRKEAASMIFPDERSLIYQPILVDIQVHNGVEVVNDGVVSQSTGGLNKNHIYASETVQAV